jgi:hydroxymethylglutaryl-CoA lyase
MPNKQPKNYIEMKGVIPAGITMLELLLRDGMQHVQKTLPTEGKLWYCHQLVRAGFKQIEVTNFGHPKMLHQFRDAEEMLERVHKLKIVQEEKPHLKCYCMTQKAFERAANMAQKGYPPTSAAFTISAEDLHGRRNSGRTRKEYLAEIPEFIKIAQENGFEIDMAIAATYGSALAGPVPVENTFELMDWGLDHGIRSFTPCDTTGESNPRRSYEFMSAMVDRYGKYDDEVKYRVAHFHECRGQSLANTMAAILAGARVIETSLGMGGGQPAFMVDGVPGLGSGPIYTNSWEVGNCPTEDCLVMLDEMGIETGIDVDLVLQLGRVFEWTMERTLPVWTTKAGRPIKFPVEWGISNNNLEHIPPYGPPSVFWASPEKYIPASRKFINREFSGRSFKWGKCNGEEEKYCRIESEDSSLSMVDIYGDEADYEYGV